MQQESAEKDREAVGLCSMKEDTENRGKGAAGMYSTSRRRIDSPEGRRMWMSPQAVACTNVPFATERAVLSGLAERPRWLRMLVMCLDEPLSISKVIEAEGEGEGTSRDGKRGREG